MRFVWLVCTSLFLTSILNAEDIVDLKRSVKEPEPIRGAVVRIINGKVDLWSSPIAHFIENRGGQFYFRMALKYLDSSAAKNLVGRVEARLFKEKHFYGSRQWELLWSASREMGNWRRHPRLRSQNILPFDSDVIEQDRSIVRYRLSLKASSHGKKQRSKRISSIISVLKAVEHGPEELAMALLLSNESLLVYRTFKGFFSELRREFVNKDILRMNLARLNFVLNRLDRLSLALSSETPLKNRLSWGLSLSKEASVGRKWPKMSRLDIMKPYFSVLDELVLESFRNLEDDIAHDRAIMYCERAIEAIERYAYRKTYTQENLRHTLYRSERELRVGEQSYFNSLDFAKKQFNEETGYEAWKPVGEETKTKYLEKVFKRAERFFNLPQYTVNLQVTSFRVLRSLLGL